MSSPFAIVVELYLGGAWVDVSLDVYGRDDVDITRGLSEWSSDVQPGRCKVTLENKAGKYSRYNLSSPYYGLLRSNIPLRVTVDGYRRFLGEVSEWPVRSDPDLHVPIEASGVWRRLSQCDSEEESPFYRGMMRAVDPTLMPAGYWPCENVEDDEAILAADTRRGAPLTVNRSPEGFTTKSGFLGSEQILGIANSQVYADFPAYGSPNDPVLTGALIKLPDAGVAADTTPLMTVNTTGTAAYWRIRANINGTLSLQVADPMTDGGLGGVIVTYGNTSWNILGRAAYIGLTLVQNGSNIDWTLQAWPEGETAPLTTTGTLNSRTFIAAWRSNFGTGHNLGDTALGHIACWKYTASLPAYIMNLANGWRGETAAARVARLAQEEGIPLVVSGVTSRSLPMRQQAVKSGLDLMMNAVDADGGVLFEPPDVPTAALGDGEDSTAGRFTNGGSVALISSTAQAHTGARSIRGTWAASGNIIQVVDSTLIVGYTYTFTAWVYIPTSQPHVKLAISGGPTSAPSTLTNTWQQLTLSWTATSYTHTLQVLPNTAPSAGQTCYIDDSFLAGDRAGLEFTPLWSLYNQAAALTLNYAAAEIALPFEPTDDDRYLVNEAVVTVEGGADPARYSLPTGPLSTAAPPNGVGRYSTSVTRNVWPNTHAFSWARWLVHQGTWAEPRYPQISVNLNRKRALIPNAALVDPGSVIVGTNPPTWLPPQQIKQIVAGLSEKINVRTWSITYNCAPARPFDVFVLDDVNYRLSTESVLASSITSSTTSLSVTSTAAGGRWTTNAGSFPFNIMVAPANGMIGEEMTVTGISGTGLTQTVTVTRGVGGVAVAWPADSAVFLAKRPTLALGQ